jgi:hypothetical protein
MPNFSRTALTWTALKIKVDCERKSPHSSSALENLNLPPPEYGIVNLRYFRWESSVTNFKASSPGLVNTSHSESEAGSNSSGFETGGTVWIKPLYLGWDFEITKD